MRAGTRSGSGGVYIRALAVVAVLLPFQAAAQDDLPSDVSFNLRQSLLEDLMTGGPNGRTVGARWTINLKMLERSEVHGLSSDCEVHVGAKVPNSRILAHPAGIVVEPPNVCKERLPEIKQPGSVKKAWAECFDQEVLGQTREVTGYPRIFTEHSSGGALADRERRESLPKGET